MSVWHGVLIGGGIALSLLLLFVVPMAISEMWDAHQDHRAMKRGDTAEASRHLTEGLKRGMRDE